MPTWTWTLITVTGAGAVHHSRGYSTRELCEEAKHIALTGMTKDEAAKRTAAERTRREEGRQRDKEWEETHPPRLPENEEEKKLVAMRPIFKGDIQIVRRANGLVQEYRREYGEGIVYNPNEGEFLAHVGGRNVIRHRHDVKHAECVLTNPELLTETKAG